MQRQTIPKISIVTPSYNQGQFLEETICSVLDQGYPNLEYIIIDGGSSDQSVEIIKSHEKHLKYWVSEADRGQTHAINKGFQHASGDIYAYLNSDDLYVPGILEIVADDYLQTIEQSRFWKAYVVEIFNSDKLVDTVYPNPDCSLGAWLSTTFGLLQPGVFWTREMHEQVGGFDESLHYVFDRNFFMQSLKQGYTYTTSQETVGARYRRHEGAKTVKDVAVFQDEYRVCDRLFLKSYPPAKRIRLKYQARRCKAWGLIADSNRTGIGRRLRIENLLGALLRYPPVLFSHTFWKVIRCLPYPVHRT